MFVWINHYFWCVEYFLWLVGLENTSTAGEIRARTSNLAQSSQTRLSESDGGSPRPSARVVAQAGGPDFWARGCLAQARWARLSELARLFLPSFIELSPRRRGARLSETPSAWATSWAKVRAGLVFPSLLIYVWHVIDGLLYNGMKGIICMCERVYELWMTNLNKSLAWNEHEMVGCESGMVMRWI